VPRVLDAADRSCYGDTKVWVRLLVESSGDIWAQMRAGSTVGKERPRCGSGGGDAQGTRRES
jgi:hypothetical protein